VSAARTRRVFPGRPESAGAARDWVASFLPGCPVLDDIVLCTSELVTDALRYSRSPLAGGRVTVQVDATAGSVRIEVTGQGTAAAGAAAARGLGAGWPIVRELADDCGEDGYRRWFVRHWQATGPASAGAAALFDDDPFAPPAATVIICRRVRRKGRTS
jgi:anti-sigma regulatory factor (Ser/Thr protein kinase)